MLDEDLFHTVDFLIAYVVVGHGDPVEDKGESLEIVGGLPVESFEEIDNEEARLESIALGMRTSEGVALELVLSRPQAADQVNLLLDQGLVSVSDARLRPSQKGFLVADGIAKLLC